MSIKILSPYLLHLGNTRAIVRHVNKKVNLQMMTFQYPKVRMMLIMVDSGLFQTALRTVAVGNDHCQVFHAAK